MTPGPSLPVSTSCWCDGPQGPVGQQRSARISLTPSALPSPCPRAAAVAAGGWQLPGDFAAVLNCFALAPSLRQLLRSSLRYLLRAGDAPHGRGLPHGPGQVCAHHRPQARVRPRRRLEKHNTSSTNFAVRDTRLFWSLPFSCPLIGSSCSNYPASAPSLPVVIPGKCPRHVEGAVSSQCRHEYMQLMQLGWEGSAFFGHPQRVA